MAVREPIPDYQLREPTLVYASGLLPRVIFKQRRASLCPILILVSIDGAERVAEEVYKSSVPSNVTAHTAASEVP